MKNTITNTIFVAGGYVVLICVLIFSCLTKDKSNQATYTQTNVDSLIKREVRYAVTLNDSKWITWVAECTTHGSKLIRKLRPVKSYYDCCDYAIDLNKTLQEVFQLFGTFPEFYKDNK